MAGEANNVYRFAKESYNGNLQGWALAVNSNSIIRAIAVCVTRGYCTMVMCHYRKKMHPEKG